MFIKEQVDRVQGGRWYSLWLETSSLKLIRVIDVSEIAFRCTRMRSCKSTRKIFNSICQHPCHCCCCCCSPRRRWHRPWHHASWIAFPSCCPSCHLSCFCDDFYVFVVIKRRLRMTRRTRTPYRCSEVRFSDVFGSEFLIAGSRPLLLCFSTS